MAHNTSPGDAAEFLQLLRKAMELDQKPLYCYTGIIWVAVKELKLSYYIGGTLLFSMYTHYGNLT